ncbi:MAG: glycerol-3-phosphate 1-O-acyltransferase PlsY [Alphaproteobacteria bacterium]|nr:glycerol-3-phosphate 1-O-acyltransferase PlsY [Rhodobiaceae bacterium]PDH51463.1 MAG: acyl-phosphate glycerol 3-phosphate acyltransferase [alpha proteobacterium MED-G09]|tara:strand:- start:22 stop:621 length:600 start_codon:yes stop_codon:yes gene_type:complete
MTILNLIFLYFLTIIISYLFGSFPSGYILSKYFNKIDITKQGSGNIGATNVLRSGSKALAILTLLIDALKGAIPVVLFSFNSYLMALAGLFSFLGHNFPVWLKFKGGKGIATYLGICFAVSLNIGISFVLLWVLITFIFKTSSISSLITISLIPIISFFHLENSIISLVFLLMSINSFYRHKLNIIRILNGEEPKINIF